MTVPQNTRLARSAAATPQRLRGDRPFVLFLCSRTVSVAGYTVTAVALPLLVLALTGSAFLTALVAAIEVVPYLLFGLLAGAVADRVNRRRLMVTCHGIAAMALASVPLASALDVLTVGHVLAVAAVIATCFVWFDAASFGMLPALVGRERIVPANSAVWTSATLMEIAFPPVAALLVATVGPAGALGVDAVSYVAAAGLLWAVPAAAAPAATGGGATATTPASSAGRRSLRAATRVIKADIREGLAFLWHHDVVRSLTLLGFGNSITGGAVTGLLVVYAVQALGLGSRDWRIGALFTAGAVGGLAASLALTRLNRWFPVGWVSIGALTANPVTLIGVALAPSLVWALPAYALWASTWVLVIINGIAARQLATPDHLQSRVNTTARMIAWGGTPLGALIGGLVAELVDVRTALLVMPLAVTTSAVLAWFSPLRRRTLNEPPG